MHVILRVAIEQSGKQCPKPFDLGKVTGDFPNEFLHRCTYRSNFFPDENLTF